jgi:hypothetical protein
MRKLIEQYRRKPDFDAENCTPIVLADGQEWYFPRPWLAVMPIIRDKEAVADVKYVTFGDNLDPLIEAIATEDDPLLQIRHVVTLAIFLLGRNYDLESDEYPRLLTYRFGDPSSDEMLKAIIDVTMGNTFRAFGLESMSDPKVCAVGYESI